MEVVVHTDDGTWVQDDYFVVDDGNRVDYLEIGVAFDLSQMKDLEEVGVKFHDVNQNVVMKQQLHHQHYISNIINSL